MNTPTEHQGAKAMSNQWGNMERQECKTCKGAGKVLSESYLKWAMNGNEMPSDLSELSCARQHNNMDTHPDEAYENCPECGCNQDHRPA